MNELAISLVQMIICSGVFYLFYKWAISRETYFAFNRLYLITSMLLSVVYGFMSFEIESTSPTSNPFTLMLDSVKIVPDTNGAQYTSVAEWGRNILILYLSVSGFLLLSFVVRLLKLWMIRRKGLKYEQENYTIVVVPDSLSPFSFFNYIFIPKSMTGTSEYERILSHERAHADQWHTLDILFIELLQIVFWFNPMVYSYKKSLKEIHEYLADAVVVKHGYDKAEYQLLIFQNAVGAQISVANCFNQSQIKNRIVMLTKKRSDALASIKGLMALPLAMFLFFTFATSSVINAQTDKGKVGDNGAYNIAAVMPVFVGGEEAIKSYIFNNVVYPKAAKEKGITGKVYIKFVVDENGKVVDASVLKSANSMLDAEALRLISGMPAWIPGKDENNNAVKVNLVIPINFALN